MAPRSARKTSAAVAETASLRQAEDAAGRRRAHGPGTADPFLGDLRRGGLLPLLVLHLASEEPAYGGRLIERISEHTAGSVAVNPNTMYPFLRSLEERDGLLAEVLPRLDAVAAGIQMIRDELGGRG